VCGIVGYTGKKRSVDLIVEGLKRLEYRGYDSAGLAVFNNQTENVDLVKSKGKISNLEKKTAELQGEFLAGIGHTRWATHGEPSENNAHPHYSQDKKLYLVHNGIIENYEQLKAVLKDEGYKFYSDTDSEVLVQLVSKYYKKGKLLEAVSNALRNVEGTYGIAVIAVDNPGEIVGARNGSPLIAGVGDGEMFIASDVSAIVAHTSQVIYLEDGDLITMNTDEFHTYDLENIEIYKEVEETNVEMTRIEKGDYSHYMLKEIYEQVETVKNCFVGRVLPSNGLVKLGGLDQIEDSLRGYKRIIITACGTSWHAALVGEYLIEELAGISVEVEYASELRYRNPIIGPDDLVVVISQSGETADTLAALREAKMRGATVIGICNGIGSTIARETHCGIFIHAGVEIGVASTKAFTSQVTALLLLAIKLGRMRQLSGNAGVQLLKDLDSLPGKIQKILNKADEIRKIANQFSDKKNFLYLGRGIQFPVALEGALKLKEISYIHAEGYPAAEMKHGPIALIDEEMPVVVIALKYGVYDKVISNINEIKARKGKVIAIATEGDDEIDKIADFVVKIPASEEALSPILSAIPLQLLSYYIAVNKGCNIDQPRNLAKSVTVE